MLARLDSWLPRFAAVCALSLVPACSGDDDDTDTGASTTTDTAATEGTTSSDAGSGSTSGDSSGSTSATGSSSGSAGSTTGATDYDYWELRVDNHPVAPVTTDYVCFDFTLSVDALTHLVGFRPVLDNATYVHHYVVELIDGPSQNPNGAGYDCGPESAAFTWAWAPGIGDYFLPEEAGFLVGDTGSQFTLRLQIHYNNPLQAQGQVDSSGFDVFYTEDLRANNAGALVVADVAGIYIPAGQEAVEHVKTCSSTATNNILTGPIQVFVSALHAHEVATVLTGEHWRDGTMLEEFNREDPYDFNQQKFAETDFQVLPGDELITRCIYDSTDQTEPVVGGVGTDDEMCWDTLIFYPRENALSDGC